MLKVNTQLDHRPDRIKIESLPDGGSLVYLYDNIREETVTEDEGTYTVFYADLVSFMIHTPITTSMIEEDFEGWWEYGIENNNDMTPVSLDQRVDALEEVVGQIIFGGDAV
jgi:hypothetical protein